MIDRVPAWTLAVTSMLTIQLGSAVSYPLLPVIGAGGTAWLRLTLGAIVFMLWARPPYRSWSAHELRVPVLLGVVTGLMTLSFLNAIERLPLGVAVAIEFLGPLTVAAVRAHSRRALVWPMLALVGVLLVTEPWTGSVNVSGVLYALGAGTGWGIYILLTQKVGDRFSGIDGLAVSIPVAALSTALVGVPMAWGHVDAKVLAACLLAALLMPVIPYVCELFALRRLTASAFGTLMEIGRASCRERV